MTFERVKRWSAIIFILAAFWYTGNGNAWVPRHDPLSSFSPLPGSPGGCDRFAIRC